MFSLPSNCARSEHFFLFLLKIELDSLFQLLLSERMHAVGAVISNYWWKSPEEGAGSKGAALLLLWRALE
jgi:hypothetical protein